VLVPVLRLALTVDEVGGDYPQMATRLIQKEAREGFLPNQAFLENSTFFFWVEEYVHFIFFFFIHLFICAYIVWIISLPCPPPPPSAPYLPCLENSTLIHGSKRKIGTRPSLKVHQFLTNAESHKSTGESCGVSQQTNLILFKTHLYQPQ
jgi:hypothetical protein